MGTKQLHSNTETEVGNLNNLKLKYKLELQVKRKAVIDITFI